VDILLNLLDTLIFIFERLNWLSLVDLGLVTLIFLGILVLMRDTQAVVLLRGVLLLMVLIGLMTSLEVLPAFSWLIQTTLPALLLSIPVVFAPEIRRALERLGRATPLTPQAGATPESQAAITAELMDIVGWAEALKG